MGPILRRSESLDFSVQWWWPDIRGSRFDVPPLTQTEMNVLFAGARGASTRKLPPQRIDEDGFEEALGSLARRLYDPPRAAEQLAQQILAPLLQALDRLAEKDKRYRGREHPSRTTATQGPVCTRSE